LDTAALTFRVAWGSSLKLAKHTGFSDTITLKLAVPSKKTKRNTIFIKIHAILMWLAWSFFGVGAVFIARYRFLFADNDRWFIVHRIFGIAGVTCGLTGFALIVYYVQHYHDAHFNVLHKIIGLVVVIAGFQQPINGMLRPQKAEENDGKRFIRVAWELYHKFMGFFGCMVLGLGNVFLGLLLWGKQPKLIYAQGAWVALVIIVFVAAEVQRCVKLRDSSDDKPMVTKDTMETQMEMQTMESVSNGGAMSPRSGVVKVVEEDDGPKTKSIQNR